MRIKRWAREALVVAVAGVSLSAAPASAEIMGNLEAPDGFASGISNVQGWAYTTTEGAELIQPFPVLINGVEQFKVPCCGDRGDVQDAFPGAPLLTGFSGVYNWGLAWTELNVEAELSADTPQGIVFDPTQITVQVQVEDTMGGSVLLTKIVDLYHPTSWPRSPNARWKTSDDPDPIIEASAPTPAGILVEPEVEATCMLSSLGSRYDEDNASMRCSGMRFTSPGEFPSHQYCSFVYYDWDTASQSFKLTSDCIGGYTEVPLSK